MKRPHRATFRLPAVALAAALLGAACATATYDRWSPPPVGATWTMQQHNTGSYGKDVRLDVTRGDGKWMDQPVVTLSNSAGVTIMASPQDGRWLAFVGRDGKPLVSWDPPIGWQYPLKAGKAWTTSHRMTLHAAGRVVPYELSCRVASFGDVAVPAGTFPAYRIDCTTTIGNEESYWVSPSLGTIVKTNLVRTAGSPFGPGTQRAEMVAQSIPR